MSSIDLTGGAEVEDDLREELRATEAEISVVGVILRV